MDGRLVGWARGVKARGGGGLPPLWLFTDAQRLRDPMRAVMRLPPGLCGVVLREMAPGEALRLRLLCRRRGVVVARAGVPGADGGLHARRGRRGVGGKPDFVTASAHEVAEWRRARRVGARLIFVSPVFATASHAGAPGLGVAGWMRLAGRGRVLAGALGGIGGKEVWRLPRWCRAVGGIGAFEVPVRSRLDGRGGGTGPA